MYYFKHCINNLIQAFLLNYPTRPRRRRWGLTFFGRFFCLEFLKLDSFSIKQPNWFKLETKIIYFVKKILWLIFCKIIFLFKILTSLSLCQRRLSFARIKLKRSIWPIHHRCIKCYKRNRYLFNIFFYFTFIFLSGLSWQGYDGYITCL